MYYVLVFNTTLNIFETWVSAKMYCCWLTATEADFHLEEKKEKKQTNQQISQQNVLVVIQLKHLADLSHTFVGLTRCFAFQTLRLPHTQHFSARGNMNPVVSKWTVSFALAAFNCSFYWQALLNTASSSPWKGGY